MNEAVSMGFLFPISDLTLLSGSTKYEHPKRFDIALSADDNGIELSLTRLAVR